MKPTVETVKLTVIRGRIGSMSTLTITEFLEARIAEDEATARAASPGPWKWEGDYPKGHCPHDTEWTDHGPDLMSSVATNDKFDHDFHPVISSSGYDASGLTIKDADADFIATNNPARVLAECAAKRAIIADAYWTHKERPTDAELHASNSNPAWEYETTEGQRKRWDDADEPPEGEGWERNTDKGRLGWDRFECTEESYWRRLKPEAERKEWQQYIPAALRALAAVYADHPDYRQEWAL